MQQFFDFPVSPGFSFDNFICCDGNKAAFDFARKISDPSDPETVLYLYGPPGSGKTHLLRAISGITIPYISLRNPVRPELLISLYADAAGMVLDDLNDMPDDADMRGAVWQLFNDFHHSGGIIAMAGSVAPRDLVMLDDHLISRLLWGLVARMDTSDDASRRMIIKKVADDHQIRIADDVIDYMLANTSRETGALILFFHRLFRCAMEEKRRITIPLAREVREQYLSEEGGI